MGPPQQTNPPSSHIDIRIEALMPKVGNTVHVLFVCFYVVVFLVFNAISDIKWNSYKCMLFTS